MRAVLLPDIVEFPSFSMHRYARELIAALRDVADDSWTINEIVCHHSEWAVRMLPGRAGKSLASRFGRIVKYPLLASRTAGDVFHVLDHSHANLLLALPASKRVITCHDCIPMLSARGEIPIKTRGFQRFFGVRLQLMRSAAMIIAISESTKQDLIRLARIAPDRIRVIYYGINESFAPIPKSGNVTSERMNLLALHRIPPDARIILHVNTQNRYKNTPALLNALAVLMNRPQLGEKVWLMRVGAAMFDDERVIARTLGIGDRIVEVGPVHGDENLAVYYRAADVFAFPSIWEGFGWPPLEAMACGTPAVTSNVASLPEVIGDAGLMVAPQDHAGLAFAIERILCDDELRRSLSAKCLSRAKTFTWERCAAQTLDVYRQVATEQSTST